MSDSWMYPFDDPLLMLKTNAGALVLLRFMAIIDVLLHSESVTSTESLWSPRGQHFLTGDQMNAVLES